MATYTAAEIKEYTSVAAVASWADSKILLFQSTAEAILESMQMDTSITGYDTAYDSAVVHIFDWIAANPTMLKNSRRGKVSTEFTVDDLPGVVQLIMRPYIQGAHGTLTGAGMKRQDIGLR